MRKIETVKKKIREIVEDFYNDEEEGVGGFGGLLNIRPPYQREFVYTLKLQRAVMDSIIEGFPLNNMYWAENEDGTFELMDGQQRTMSFCSFIEGEYSIPYEGVEHVYFDRLPVETQELILDTEITLSIFRGTEHEKLRWFERLNTAGVRLSNQELLNAAYVGPWVVSAKQMFSSKTPNPAERIAKGLVDVKTNRQELLEVAIDWASGGKIGEYMAEHRNKNSARHLLDYFEEVITWASSLFPKLDKKYLKNQKWGKLYQENKDTKFDPDLLHKEAMELVASDDVKNKRGIIPFLLTRDVKYLSIRAFPSNISLKKYEEQRGVCPHCDEEFSFEKMEADHIIPWTEGGETTLDNCQMLCRKCNRKKGSK